MEAAGTPHLDYAPPQVKRGGRPYFRTVLALFAVGGIWANLALIEAVTEQFYQAQWLYHDLVLDPQAYGRTIDPVTVDSLHDLRPVWAACGAFGVAAAFGLLLAVNLLVAAMLVDRNQPAAERRLTQYHRWKPVGIVATVAAGFWASSVSLRYWVAASHHHPLGSGPPVIEAAVLVACALIPWWWVAKRFELRTP